MVNKKIEITEEKVRKLKPIFERIFSRKYGQEIKFTTLTVGEVTIKEEKEKP